jgi:hypothetical protein
MRRSTQKKVNILNKNEIPFDTCKQVWGEANYHQYHLTLILKFFAAEFQMQVTDLQCDIELTGTHEISGNRSSMNSVCPVKVFQSLVTM